MALLTSLSFGDVQPLGQRFGVNVGAIEPLEAGSVNSNFLLTDMSNRRYFARLYEEQSVTGALAEHRLLNELKASGVPVVLPLANTELPTYQGKPFAVFPFVDGEILCQARVTPEVCRKVGTALAKVHLATPDLSHLPEGRFNRADLELRLDQIEAEAPSDLIEAARRIRGIAQRYAERRDPSLPRGLIHGDLFRDNVLWQKNEIAALIDFESASAGPFAFDVAVALLAWCYADHFDADLVRGLLSGYHAERPLSKQEQLALPVEAGLVCVRFATTRITDYSMRARPGEAPIRDYRRFLTRLTEIESGVLRAGVQGPSSRNG